MGLVFSVLIGKSLTGFRAFPIGKYNVYSYLIGIVAHR